jgi:hypothetical protein
VILPLFFKLPWKTSSRKTHPHTGCLSTYQSFRKGTDIRCKNISKQGKVLVNESEDSKIYALQSHSQARSEDFAFLWNHKIPSNTHPKMCVIKNSGFFEILPIPMHLLNLLRWLWVYPIVKKNISIIAWVGRFKKNPKILLSTWNSDIMSNSLPKKQTVHHLIASRNACFFAVVHSKPLQSTIHPIRRLFECCLTQGVSRKIRRFSFPHETAT